MPGLWTGVEGCLTYPVIRTVFFLDCGFAICTHQAGNAFKSDKWLISHVRKVSCDLVLDEDALYSTTAGDERIFLGIRSNVHHTPLIASGGCLVSYLYVSLVSHNLHAKHLNAIFPIEKFVILDRRE